MGWLQLSVNVPRDIGKNGKPYLWAGVYCSVYCLASDIASLARQEEAAHSLFTPDRAEHLAGLSGTN